MAIVARILHRNWIVGPVWLQKLALELANVGRQPRPPSLPNRNKRCRVVCAAVPCRRVRRAAVVYAALEQPQLRAPTQLAATSAAACLPPACAQRVLPLAACCRLPSLPPPTIYSGPWVQVGVSAFRFRSAIHGGHF